ncbi:MAG TPA: Ig-like domain-containing protein [Anaerolineales bacterium]|nr:Ig-like domain-containing protein [Anaerolineales bacterium]
MRRHTNLFVVTFVLISLLITSIFPAQTVAASPSYAPAVAATLTDTIVNDGVPLGEAADGKADPGETIEYTAVIQNSGADPATGVTFQDIIDLNTTLVAGSVNVSPLAANDSYATIGNTLLEVGVTASGSPSVKVTGAAIDSLFDNDTEFLGDSFTLLSVEADTTAPFTTATESGGTVTVEGDGNFSYIPPVGFSGADHFDYVITDDGAVGSGALTSAGRVTINVNAQEVWYVNNNAGAGGLGRSTDPFDTLLEAQTASGLNDTIFVFHAGGDLTGQNNGVILKNGQRLIGEAVDLEVAVGLVHQSVGGPNPTHLHNDGSRPAIGNAAGNGVTLSTIDIGDSFSGVEIRGLDISGTAASANAVDVTTHSTFSGSFELGNNVISGAGAEGVDVNGGGGGTLTINIHDNTVTATGNGIDIARTAGNVTVTTFDDNVVHGNTGGIGISVVGTGGSVLFDSNPDSDYDLVSGGTAAIGQSGNAVGSAGLVLNNVRGDLSFSDLDVYANGAALLVDGTTSNFLSSGTGTRITANTGTPTLDATGGPAANLTEIAVNLALNSLTSTNSTTTGVSMLEVSGTFTATSGSSITNAGTTDFFIDGNLMSTATVSVTYNGTITDDTGSLIQIVDVTSGSPTYAFTGAITDGNDGDGSGITLTNNDSATIRFSGGLLLSTGSSPAFTATAGATAVEVCDENPCNPAATGAAVNTLTTTTGTALNIVSTTMGANNLEFRSISANGASSGIVLNTTGNGGLKVTGNGGTCTSAVTCTGGAIQNTTGAGVALTNAKNVSFTRMYIANTGSHGVNGTGMSDGSGGATPTFAFLNGFMESPGNADNESALYFDTLSVNNILGTMTVADTTIQNFEDVGIHVGNQSGTLTVNVTNVRINNNSDTNGEEGIDIFAEGTSTINVNISNSRFQDLEGGSMNIVAQNSGTIDMNIDNNVDIGTGGPDNFPTPPTMTFSSEGTASNFFFDVTNNRIHDASGDGIFIGHEGEISGRITGNIITGVVLGDGIRIDTDATGNQTTTFLIQNNQIGTLSTFESVTYSGIGDDGIQILDRDGTKTMNLTINNNQIANTASEAIRHFADDDVTGGGPTNNLAITNNTLTNIGVADAIVIISQDPGVEVCANIGGNNLTATTNKNIFLQQSLSAVLRIPQASVAAMGAANTSATASSSGTITTGVTCAVPVPTNAMLPDDNQVVAQNHVETNLVILASAATTNLNSANTLVVASASMKPSEQASAIAPADTVVNTSTSFGGGKPLFRVVQPAPSQVGPLDPDPISIGTLPAGKSVTIKFQVTVNGPSLPAGTTKITTQGTVESNELPDVLTTNGGTVDCETGSETCTPVDRPDTTVSSINRAASSPTNADSVSWSVTFANAVSGLTSSNFTLVNSGLGGSPAITGVTAVGGSPATQWTVTASTGTGDGTLELRMANDIGLSHDVTNLPYTQSSSGAVYTIDQTAPTVTNVDSNSNTGCIQVNFIDYCNAGDVVNIQVTFSEMVTVTGAPTLTLDLDGIDRDAIYSSGSGTNILTFSYTVQTGDNTNPAAPPSNELDYVSTSSLSLNGGTIQDAVTNNAGLTLASPGAANSLGATEDIIIDTIAPSTTSFTRFNPSTSPTNADILVFRVTFSEPVRFVGIADFVVHDNTPSATITTAIDGIGTGGGGMVFDVTLDGTDDDPGDLAGFNGTVSLDFNSAAPADFLTDRAGNNLPKTEPATDQEYTVDNTALTVTITSAAPDPINASPIPVTVQFSRNVTGFDSGDITAGNGTVDSFIAVDGDTYTFDLTPGGQGWVTADIAAGVAQDSIGNLNTAASQLSRTFDTVVPTVAITSAASDPTNTLPISVTAQFSENVTDFNAGDITLGNATVGNFIAVDGDTYTFDLTPSSQGWVTADIAAGVATDTAGNDNTVAAQFSRTFDGDAPTVAMTSAAPNPTNTSPIPVTVQFSEHVTVFNAGDITVSNTALSNFVAVDGDTYTFDLTPSAQGLVTADIAAGVAQDSTGNLNSAASQFIRTFDTVVPTVTINQTAGQVDPTGSISINFQVVFSEPVNGFDDGSSDVNLSGTAGATTAVITEIAPNDGTTYSVAVSGMTGTGTVIASVPAATAMDAAGNNHTASTSTDNTVTYILDIVPPDVTINQAAGQGDPTIATSINFTAVFSEAVSGFSVGDVVLSGTAGATTSMVTQIAPNDGTTFNVAVSGMTASGTVIAAIPAGVANDAANHGNLTSTSLDNVVTYSISHGGDTTGVYRPSSGPLFLKNSNTTGVADVSITYGIPGDKPVIGDWDGDGDVTIGVYRNGSFYLRNSNTPGNADMVFSFGLSGDQPIAGDWDGDGDDTIGVYRPSTGQFLLKNSNSAGVAELSFYLGNVGDVGIAGDWDGDGKDTTGVFRPSSGMIFLKNTNVSGFADIALNYGIPGDKHVVGDWDGDGIDTIGVYRNGTFYLRNSNTAGIADIVFHLGIPGDVPIAGNWDGLP